MPIVLAESLDCRKNGFMERQLATMKESVVGQETFLTLRPATGHGWFGGRGFSASAAAEVRHGVTPAEAADALQAEFEGRHGNEGATAVLAAYDGRCTVVRFSAVEEITAPSASPRPVADPARPLLRDASWDLSPRGFRAAVRATRERIAAGDVYVLNLTARLSGTLDAPTPRDAFTALCARADADMAALLEGLPGSTPWIASVSPERFLRIKRVDGDARTAEIRPIKGTRARGATPALDARAAADLLADRKERAEHVMVVDMERNDLGVCCVPGSVHVDPLYEVVGTPYCHQLVSTVRGTLRPDATFRELLAATFPCGSVTGAPKRAAMRIIDGLEATPRGAYCGALLVAVAGELDSAVLIRTLEGVADSPGVARWGAGCGITHDSDAAAEHLEMLLKSAPVTGDGTPEAALRETMRVAGASVPLLDRHLARLAAGGAGPTLLAKVRAAVGEELVGLSRCERTDVAGGGDSAEGAGGRLSVTVTREGEVVAGLSREPSSLAVEGVRVAAVEVAEASELPSGAAKPAARHNWDKAHRAARLAGADQALLHLPDGTLVDGSTATLWLVRDGVLMTPPSPPAVAGVARELIFDVADAAGIPAEERRLNLPDLDSADEVWLSNAYGGMVPVHGRGGTIGEAVAEATEASWAVPRTGNPDL